MFIKFILVLLLSVSLNYVSSYKILVVFPFPGKSHTILGDGYVRHLLNAGHHVTYITSIPMKTFHPNLRQINLSSNLPLIGMADFFDFKKVLEKQVDLSDPNTVYEEMLRIANLSINHKDIQTFMMDLNEQFDLVIAEWLYTELYCGFAAVFNCPYIWSSSMEPHPAILSLVDEIPNPAYAPDHTSTVIPPMSFSERVNELFNLYYLFRKRWSLEDSQEKVFQRGYGPAAAKRGHKLPTLEEFKYNGSMVLANSHVSTGLAQHLPPNYIPISGYHIDNDLPPLPEYLQRILDDAPHGVIYFSMGTLIKSATMPLELKHGLLNVFRELKQTVIWKFEEEMLDLPHNVHVVQWAPQQSILAHPNCILFITHGGLLSTTEALHFGKPVIGIPVFSDQIMNVMKAQKKGFGLVVKLGYDTPANLKPAIEEIIGNPKYRQKAKELSFVYHDRLVKPEVELVHWVEHVIKTQGAPHLRSPALRTPLYQKLYLDFIAVVLISLLVIIWRIKKLLTPNIRDWDKKKN